MEIDSQGTGLFLYLITKHKFENWHWYFLQGTVKLHIIDWYAILIVYDALQCYTQFQ